MSLLVAPGLNSRCRYSFHGRKPAPLAGAAHSWVLDPDQQVYPCRPLPIPFTSGRRSYAVLRLVCMDGCYTRFPSGSLRSPPGILVLVYRFPPQCGHRWPTSFCRQCRIEAPSCWIPAAALFTPPTQPPTQLPPTAAALPECSPTQPPYPIPYHSPPQPTAPPRPLVYSFPRKFQFPVFMFFKPKAAPQVAPGSAISALKCG